MMRTLALRCALRSLALTFAAMLAVPVTGEAQRTLPWWPTTGAVILEGGHIESPTFDGVARRLIALAGGPNALIVIIPTANEAIAPRLRGIGPAFDPNGLKKTLESKGALRVTVLHTRERQVANSEEFARVLRTARGVWIPGGGARILEDTYRGTLVAR
jgi:cyanophycinase